MSDSTVMANNSVSQQMNCKLLNFYQSIHFSQCHTYRCVSFNIAGKYILKLTTFLIHFLFRTKQLMLNITNAYLLCRI